jgi:hypothetical protein
MTILRGVAIALAIVVKLVAAAVAFYYVHPIGVRVAENWMGVRGFSDGAGVGLLCAAAVATAFVAGTALAALAQGRARAVLAAGATAQLFTAAGLFLAIAWIATSLSLHNGARLIATDMYNKYPPILASYDLEAYFVPLGLLVLLADLVVTLIAANTPRRGTALSTADTSRAAT